ncbi:hypothetical protein J7W19_20610 [Streptomyces mobaraensis NBRC 13819 = DSM 40847]|uniref:Secreted protein n=1 Tax=Streptomyces mobaraensis (strain ATCC 29032 / DSM 40847 / JCM 4168 / NBRC 13819 / NCIMB 11159 / IPCR 16-22) TaxID=1223523 RepID=M3AZ21_STRM1|nr:hypothetical protein [Streptomyces mobaraensis]EME98907.1 hypothetical protein H340_18968 [Streptomyces mobaraensis NBRC 13819 = DSM 40847]QTT75456.1 hypothetical protein J7W19_20610 [Streptomyces mobaraensis NBRC 13819 = DSM 40847]
MSTGRRNPRAVLPVSLAIAAVLALSGCGGDGDGGGDERNASGRPTAADTGEPEPESQAKSSSSRPLGEMRNGDGIVVTITSAAREGGGFVTVQGTVTNHGTKMFNALEWRSKETDVRSQSAVSGATLVDTKGKKRYLVLRDTDGQCLCSTGLTGIKPQESRPLFAQFPAPPADVSQVDFQIPTMPTVRIALSG